MDIQKKELDVEFVAHPVRTGQAHAAFRRGMIIPVRAPSPRVLRRGLRSPSRLTSKDWGKGGLKFEIKAGETSHIQSPVGRHLPTPSTPHEQNPGGRSPTSSRYNRHKWAVPCGPGQRIRLIQPCETSSSLRESRWRPEGSSRETGHRPLKGHSCPRSKNGFPSSSLLAFDSIWPNRHDRG